MVGPICDVPSLVLFDYKQLQSVDDYVEVSELCHLVGSDTPDYHFVSFLWILELVTGSFSLHGQELICYYYVDLVVIVVPISPTPLPVPTPSWEDIIFPCFEFAVFNA